MRFDPEKVDEFLLLFQDRQYAIKHAPGCISLQLLIHNKYDGVIFTYSKWESEESLENYRQSKLFLDTWNITKKYFNGKPEAWTSIIYNEGL